MMPGNEKMTVMPRRPTSCQPAPCHRNKDQRQADHDGGEGERYVDQRIEQQSPGSGAGPG